MRESRPDRDRGGGCPGSRAGAQATDSEECRDQRSPSWGLRARRPFGRLRAGSRDSRLDAGATGGSGGGRYGRGKIGLHDSSSGSSGLLSRMDSSASVTGEEITYWPLAHLPRSMRRQRSLQKGKSGPVVFTDFLQIGQRSLTGGLRGIHSFQEEDRYTILATRS